MRRSTPPILFLFLLGPVVGCTAPDASSTVESKLDAVKKETKEAAQTVQEYTYAQRAEFIRETKAELAKIEQEMDRLSAKAENSRGKAAREAKDRVAAVREKSVHVRRQLERAESATEATWDDAKAGVKGAYGSLKDSFEDTRQWLSDKIAP